MIELNDFEIDVVSGGTGLLAIPALLLAVPSTGIAVVGATMALIPVVGPFLALPVMAVGAFGLGVSAAILTVSTILPTL